LAPVDPEPLTRADVLTATEASALLGIPRSTLYDLARQELPARQIGRRWIFRKSLLNRATLQGEKVEADDEARTRDLRLGKPTLYQLSYIRVSRDSTGRSGMAWPRRTGELRAARRGRRLRKRGARRR
jgi:excisionase family DNA binding protein